MKKSVLIFVLISLNIQFIFSQIAFGTGGTYGITVPSITSIGIGNFTTSPLAALHVNSTLMPPNTNFSAGDVFRTTGQANQVNTWRLYTNNQKFRVFVPANSNEANLEAVQAAGYLNLNTAGGTNTAYPNIKLRIFPDDLDRMVAFESPFIANPTTFTPGYNAKFIINDRNNTSSLSSLVDDALLLRVQGIGKILPGLPAALPIGSGEGYGNFTMAEIISTRRNVGDAGLRLQGSRTACQKCDIGFIDFANYDQVDPILGSDVLFNMARLASGSQARDSSRGYIRFYTNNGSGDPSSANDAGLLERMRINGFGDGFFNLVPVNGQANMMNVTARFNILDNDRPQMRLINFANTQNIAKIYTNLQTTDNGDLFIQPLDETISDDSLHARFVGIHTSKPQNTLDINSTKASPRWNELSTHGTSGLRFTNLSALNKPMVNPGKGVLAVDSNGNVVYVKAQSGFASCEYSINGVLDDYSKLDLNNFNFYFTKNDLLGSNHVGIGYDCESILPAKLSVLQIHPLEVNASTISVSGINKDVSNISGTVYTGVEGIAGGLQTISKVINRGGYFSASNATDIRGLVVELPSSTVNTASAIGGEYIVTSTATDNTGVFAQSSGVTATGTNIGVHGRATNSDKYNIGGNFIALTTSANGISTGVVGSGEGSNIFNAGGFFSVTTNNNAANMAIYARGGVPTASLYPAAVAIGVYSNSNVSNNGLPGYAGYFDGNVYINGPASGSGFAVVSSDENLKTDIQTIENADSLLLSINPTTFYFDTNNVYGLNFSNEKQYGLIAQQVETILPELIINQHKPAMIDSLGNIITEALDYKALNYGAFTSILIKGHQEQRTEIENLKSQLVQKDSMMQELNSRLTQLENCLSGILPFLCQLSNSSIQQTPELVQEQIRTAINVNLSDTNTIILNQNVPNPFAESTVINFSIPATVVKAQMHFYDGQGKLINSVEITNRGDGQLKVFGEDLSSGTYTYTLVADGQIVSTKKMVKE